jgi:hypothetical protein
MAEVVWLKPAEAPPEDRSWALVSPDRDGRHAGEDVVAHSQGITFYIPHPPSEAERSEAIARARTWAERNGVDAIYVDAR